MHYNTSTVAIHATILSTSMYTIMHPCHYYTLTHNYPLAYSVYTITHAPMSLLYSELPLIRTPEMWTSLYSGHSEMSQSMLYSTNAPLK